MVLPVRVEIFVASFEARCSSLSSSSRTYTTLTPSHPIISLSKMAMATTTLPADTLDPSLRNGLLEYFPSSLLTPDSAPLLTEVLSILRIYNLTPSDLADKWESFCLNKKHLLAEVEDGDPFQLENVKELKKHIQEGLERETRTNKRTSIGTPVARGGRVGMANDMYRVHKVLREVRVLMWK